MLEEDKRRPDRSERKMSEKKKKRVKRAVSDDEWLGKGFG